MRLIALAATLCLFGILSAAPAYANRSNPSGTAGKFLYNKNHHVMEYCDGTTGSRWVMRERAVPHAPTRQA